MNASEYKKLKRQIEDQYQRTIQAAEKQRMDALSAIDKVWNMLHEPRRSRKENNTTPSVSNNQAGQKPYGSLKEAVIKALEYVPATFTKDHIAMSVEQQTGLAFKHSSITGCLIRLVKKGVIRITKEGKGSSPTEYQKVASAEKNPLFEKG